MITNEAHTARATGFASALLLIALLPSCTVQDSISEAPSAMAPEPPALHVASPDWRDQIIYFAMIDRFDDGDTGNNDQGEAEFDPAVNAKYSGGDLAGLTRRLDYIKGLGATAVWITPPVRNRWWDERSQYGGYHGYWAENLLEVDPHYGTLDDYRQLSSALHGRGMYLVQDIVVNHMGNYFSYPTQWKPDDPTAGFVLNADRHGRHAPTQWPFTQNDARSSKDRAAAIYHWTPTITDFNNRLQEETFQLADLDDLNTENPRVRSALRQSYGYWIDQVGVDAYRVDTAFYVPPAFFDDFLHSDDAEHPGILRVAARHGQDRFHVFGEGFGVELAYADGVTRKINRYLRDSNGRELLPGMINFPLYGTIGDVFVRGRPTAELGHRIRSMMQIHPRPALMPTFVDNHDVDRFLSTGSKAALQQSLLLTMTLPGIPTIYYGTEQGFVEQRGAMFAQGFKSGGQDRFDTGAPLYRFIQDITRLRRSHPLLSRGAPEVLHENAAGAGAFAFAMRDGSDAALIVINSADNGSLLDHLDIKRAPGTVLKGVYGIQGLPPDLVVGADGKISLELNARSGQVWRVSGEQRPVAAAVASLNLQPLVQTERNADFAIGGIATGVTRLQVVVDGDLLHAPWVAVDVNGRWQSQIDTGNMIDPAIEHSVVAWDAASGRASERAHFRVRRDWTRLTKVEDPAGDDGGPRRTYRYPANPNYSEQRPLDLRGAEVFGSGGALRIKLKMNRVVAEWNPVNGFDHVAFTLFFAMPNAADGATALPLQNASLPDGLRWQYRLRANGWSNAMFSADGASASNEGTARIPGSSIAVDRSDQSVSFTLPAAAIGRPKSLSGMKIYINTWDYDGGYKLLSKGAHGHGFHGGDGQVEPLIMDSMLLEMP